jgi:hypothetical protein
MALRYQYFPEHDLIVEYLEGHLDLDAAKDLKRSEVTSGDLGPDTRILAVVGEVTYDSRDTREFGPWLREAYGDLDPRAAYLVRDPGSTALMMLLQRQFRDRPVEVFSTLERALDWLGLDPANITADELGIEPTDV